MRKFSNISLCLIFTGHAILCYHGTKVVQLAQHNYRSFLDLMLSTNTGTLATNPIVKGHITTVSNVLSQDASFEILNSAPTAHKKAPNRKRGNLMLNYQEEILCLENKEFHWFINKGMTTI